MPEQSTAIETVANMVASASRIVVLTGAGVSTGSGIPDFRGPEGVWTRNPLAEKMSHIDWYVSDPEVRKLAWQHRLHSPMWSAEPNRAHRALVDLERSGRLHVLLTQNVDGLHQRAGSNPDLVVEVHGTVQFTRCLDCDERLPMEDTIERLRAGEEDPECLACGGMLKSDVVSFGQSLVLDDIERAMRSAAECDLLLALGTTLAVTPINDVVPIAKAAGADVVIINRDPTAMDSFADVVIRSELGETLDAIVRRAGMTT